MIPFLKAASVRFADCARVFVTGLGPVGQFFFFGVTELFTFFLITANFRAIALGNYFWAGTTDFATLMVNFSLFRVMTGEERMRSWYVGVGSSCGGTIGTLLSIYVTKHVYGA